MRIGAALRRVPAAFALLAVAAAPAGSADDVRSYRFRLEVRPGPGAGVQRLAIPAAVLAAAQAADLTDVRIFDAQGRPMPIARAPARAAALRRTPLPPMPILGAADALKVRGVSLKLDDAGRAHVARVDGTFADGGAATLLGILLDARLTKGKADALSLDAVQPAGQPVTFTLEASRDLATWRRLGERTLYRPPGAAALSVEAVPLGAASLDGDYLRVTWRAGSRLLAPVQVRTAVLASRPADADDAEQVEAALPPSRDAHIIEVAIPFATQIATLSITPTAGDLLVPVRILGRDSDEQPWTVLGTGVATRGAGATRPSAPIALDGAAFRLLRIEADEQSAGFSAAPTLRIGFARRDLLFLASGTAPFTLAAGRAATASAYLSPDDLLRSADGAVTDATPARSPARLRLAAPDSGSGRRRAMLWAVLLAATGVLAGFAWSLWRRDADADTPGESENESGGG